VRVPIDAPGIAVGSISDDLNVCAAAGFGAAALGVDAGAGAGVDLAAGAVAALTSSFFGAAGFGVSALGAGADAPLSSPGST
jgi:hypothetical protein